jgi:hypothetical protein
MVCVGSLSMTFNMPLRTTHSTQSTWSDDGMKGM